jgi:hypothetical protein
MTRKPHIKKQKRIKIISYHIIAQPRKGAVRYRRNLVVVLQQNILTYIGRRLKHYATQPYWYYPFDFQIHY